MCCAFAVVLPYELIPILFIVAKYSDLPSSTSVDERERTFCERYIFIIMLLIPYNALRVGRQSNYVPMKNVAKGDDEVRLLRYI